MDESSSQMPKMTVLLRAALDRHAAVVSTTYWETLGALDTDAYLPNSALMYQVNSAMFARPEVAAMRFMRHSRHESSGSRFIDTVAERFAEDAVLRERLRAHARDEERHCHMFEALAERLSEIARAPAAAPPVAIGDDDAIDAFDGDMTNFLIATHAAEVRNLALLHQYSKILSLSGADGDERILRVLDRVKEDESRHVAYTAEYVCREFDRSAEAIALFAAYTEGYVQDSWREVAEVCRNIAEPKHRENAHVD